MKKLVFLILAVCMCLPISIILTACGHEHTYQTEWSKDAAYHWHSCQGSDCTEVADKAGHSFDKGICTVCNGLQTVGLVFQSNGDGTCVLTDAGNNADSNVVIPEKSPEGDTVVEIGREALWGHSMTSIFIPNTVKKIGWAAFGSCENLTTLDLPEGITQIDNRAFENCTALASVSFPDTLTRLGENAFKNTALQFTEYNDAVYLSNGVNSYAYLIREKDANVSTVHIHENTILIADFAFANNYNITSVTIPGNVKHIGEYAFGSNGYMRMEITAINLSEGLLTIAPHAFERCMLVKSITIPSTVISIGKEAFPEGLVE